EALEQPLIHFHRELLSPQDKGVSRDLGVALVEGARHEKGVEEFRLTMTQLALPLLAEATEADPGDLVALEARGHARRLRDHAPQALAMFEKVLQQADRCETALQGAQTVTEAMGDQTAALEYGRRLIAVNPWNWQYHYYQARLLAVRLEWTAASKEC